MYQRAMGGYMMKIVSGKVYAAKLDPSSWEFFADGTPITCPINLRSRTA
jgi:hypothetical protein